MIRNLYALPCSLTLATLLFLASLPLAAQVDGAYNTTPYDSLHPDPGAGGRYSALWGYTAPDGREYALLGGYSGTHIIDITEKPITQVAFIPGARSGWREMKTYGTIAYIVSEGGRGLQIVDLSDLPNSATLIKEDTSAFRTGHTITQEGDWIYVHGTNVEAGYNQGTMIFEVAEDPLNPVLVGSYTRDYVHDVTIRNDTMYAAMIENGRLDIVLLSEDRTETTFINQITYPGAGTHSSDLTGDGTYIMTTDEIGTTAKTMKVWDRSDVDDIVKVAEWTPVPDAIIHNIRRNGNLAYIAWYTAGTRIADISDPLNPVEVGFYDFYPGGGSGYNGNWEVYPYFESGKIIASSTTDGLHVFTFNGSGIGSAVITVRDSISGDPLAGVTVELPELGRTVTTDAAGKIILSAAEGQTPFNATLLNYRRKEGTIELQSSGNEVEILLAPLRLHTVRVRVDDRDGSGNATSLENPFAWDLLGRPEEGKTTDGNIELQLPVDSGYTLVIDAWGYLPEEVAIPQGDGGEVIVVTFEPGYRDNADLDLGWSLGEPDDDGSAGFWERGTPVGVEVIYNGGSALVEPGEDGTPGPGGKAFMTDIAPEPGVSPGLFDVDSGRVTLTSPPINLSLVRFGVPPAGFDLKFRLWFSNDAVPFFPADDKLYVRLSNDGGASWVDVLTLSSGLEGWTEFRIYVDEFLEPSSDMLFRVVVSDSLEQGWVEAGLDDFEIAPIYFPGVNEENTLLQRLDLAIRPLPLDDNGVVTLSAGERIEGLSVELFNALGELVQPIWQGDLMPGSRQLPIDVKGLPDGAYHLVLRDRSGEVRRLALPITR